EWVGLGEGWRHLLAEDQQGRFGRMTAAFHLVAAQLAGDAGSVLSFAQRLLDLHTNDACDRAMVRAIACTAQGSAQLSEGDLAAAAEALGDGLAAAEQAGLNCPQLECTGKLALLHAGRGELRRAERSA